MQNENRFDIDIDKLIDDIERYVNYHNMDYIDATVHFCEENDIEIESLAEVIPPSLQGKIAEAARAKRLFKKEYNNISMLPV